MPTNQTANYALSQWAKSDQVKMEDFNADNAKIDEALGALTETAAAHAAALALRGNCRIEAFSYTGQSVDGQGYTHTLTFSKRPAFVLVFGANCITLIPGGAETGLFAGSYASISGSRTIMAAYFTWAGNSVLLNNNYPEVRMDVKGKVYQVIAWIPMDVEA